MAKSLAERLSEAKQSAQTCKPKKKCQEKRKRRVKFQKII